MAPSECYQHEAKPSSFTRSLYCWRSLSLTTVMWLNRYRSVVKTPVLVHRGICWVFPALKKPLVKWSSLPSLTLPVQGTLQRALRNFLKLVPSPSHFQSTVELGFQSESFKKKKKIPVASRVILVTSREGERNVQTFPQPLLLLISLREAASRGSVQVTTHCPEPSCSVYLFMFFPF